MRNVRLWLCLMLVVSACSLSDLSLPTGAPQQPPAQPSPVPSATQPAPPATPTAEPTPTPVPYVNSLPEPGSAQWTFVAGGLAQPLDIQHAGDDRLFVVEQPGVIRILQGDTLLPEPFLDIRQRVENSGNEQGLLGLAFDPQYAENGLFYINYTGAGGDTRIASFRVSSDPNLADPGSEQVLLSYGQPFRNHNGGGLAFGPDGYLYVGSGDGGSAGDPQGNGQRLDTLLGKVLRLAVSAGEYAIPPDNPFVNQAGARPEIWAYGLRNPWRLAFDGLTGGLYIADVGQNAWEEVNHQPANLAGGVNYGWNLLEGSQAYAGGGQDTTLPVAEYSHQNGCSVTGGVVMRDPGLPDWNGVYLYGDYCSGLIWGLLPATDGGWHNGLLFDTDFLLTGLGVGADGRVYLAHRDGEIYRLSPAQ